jgi:anti-sigma regulatory factor (Ser/Thr protein kinase)
MARSELRIANRLSELEGVREWVERFGADQALPAQVLTGLLVSFDEVLNNVISYGYTDRDEHAIVVRLVFADGVVSAEVEDDGMPYDPLAAPPPKLGGGFADRPIGGVGIHFLRTLNDEVNYARQDNKNRLTFTQRVSSAQ